MPATITPERLDTADASALIAELEAHLASLYPSESRHGYAVQKLIAEDVAFFLMREADVPAGCGGVLRLETGIHQTAAISLYERAGFRPITPFGAYKADPLSRFFEKRIL